MTTVLAAIDNSAAARPVLETALRLGHLLKASVQALHIRQDGADTAVKVAASMGVPLSILDGDPTELINTHLAAPDVMLGVLGARGTPAGCRPAGHIAAAIATATAKPLVVVAPNCRACGPPAGGRVLVPLDGTQASADALRGASQIFADAGVDIVGLHVFDQSTLPRFWDQPHHAAESWGREFSARHLTGPDSRLELRTGSPGSRVVDVAEEEHVDLVAMCWSQDLSTGHAQTVKDVLEHSHVPVLLLPMDAQTQAIERGATGER